MFPWESAGLMDGEVTSERGPADPVTGDDQFMQEWGAEIILATAVFWADRVEWDGDVCHIRDIIEPDEYKERVNDNTYTNYMVKHNLALALQLAERIERENPDYLSIDSFRQMGILGSEKLMEAYSVNDLRQFQVHKQADLIMLLWLFPELIPADRQKKHWRQTTTSMRKVPYMTHPTAMPPMPWWQPPSAGQRRHMICLANAAG